MIKIKIVEQVVRKQEGTSKRTGKDYSIPYQMGWVDLGKAFPVEARITLDRDQAPFPVGDYTLSPQCFSTDAFGQLQVDLRHMQPLRAMQPQAASVPPAGVRVAG